MSAKYVAHGFDFLGFNFRKYHGKLLIKPATTSTAAVKEKVRVTSALSHQKS